MKLHAKTTMWIGWSIASLALSVLVHHRSGGCAPAPLLRWPGAQVVRKVHRLRPGGSGALAAPSVDQAPEAQKHDAPVVRAGSAERVHGQRRPVLVGGQRQEGCALGFVWGRQFFRLLVIVAWKICILNSYYLIYTSTLLLLSQNFLCTGF